MLFIFVNVSKKPLFYCVFFFCTQDRSLTSTAGKLYNFRASPSASSSLHHCSLQETNPLFSSSYRRCGSILSLVQFLFSFVLAHNHTLSYKKALRKMKIEPRIKLNHNIDNTLKLSDFFVLQRRDCIRKDILFVTEFLQFSVSL